MHLHQEMMDIDNLLRSHTVQELKDVEQKLRTDVERKKEDLRELVSVRYRELIDAADKISGMHKSIVQVSEHLQKLRSIQPINHQFSKTSKKSDNLSAEQFYAEVEVLLSHAPDLIFTFLDHGKPLYAAVLFSFARNAVWKSSLLNPESAEPKSWSFLRIHSEFVQQNILTAFENTSYSSGEMLSYFAALNVLKPTLSLREIFEMFLTKRTAVLQQLFSSTSYSSRESIELILATIFSTIKAAREVSSSESVSAFLKDQEKVTRDSILSSIYPGESLSSELVESFTAVFSILPNIDQNADISSLLRNWLDILPKESSQKLDSILSFVGSFNGLSVLHEALKNTVSVGDKETELRKISYEVGVDYSPLIRWIEDALQRRFELLLSEKLSELWKETCSVLEKEISKDSDVEQSSKIFTPSLSGFQQMGKQNLRRKVPGTLKRNVISDDSFSAESSSSVFHSKLTIILAEIQQHFDSSNPEFYWTQESISATFKLLLESVSTSVKDFTSKRTENDSSSSKLLKIHQSFDSFSSSLSSLLSPTTYSSVSTDLKLISDHIFSVWLSETLDGFTTEFSATLSSQIDPVSWSVGVFPFQKISVEEKNDLGETVSYSISIPSRISIGLFEALRSRQMAFVSFGNHSKIDSGIAKFYEILAECYKRFVEESKGKNQMWKNQIVQLIFDLKFVHLMAKSRKGLPIGLSRNFQKLIDDVAVELDPIDYSAMREHLEKNAAVCLSTLKGFVYLFCGMDLNVSVELPSADVLKSMYSDVIVSKDLWISELPLFSESRK